MRHSETLQNIADRGRLGAFRFQKFQPRRCREKQIAHLDPRAARSCRRCYGRDFTAIDRHGVGAVIFCGAAGQFKMRDRANAGQRLAAKAEAGNLKHPIAAITLGQFGGGVAFNRQSQRLGAHAMAIIFDQNKRLAATAEADIYLCRARINGVFDKLFHRAGRTLHHFTRCNAVNGVFGQAANVSHYFTAISER